MNHVKNKKYLNESGITLIEVIASLLILTIILISFMNFFPIMGKSNNQTGEKQQAINLARSELIYWQNIINKKFMNNPTLGSDDIVQKDENSIKILTSSTNSMNTMSNEFDVEIIINTVSDLNINHIKIEPGMSQLPKEAHLIQINIYKQNSIENGSIVSGSMPLSTNYGYVFF
ncbi:hypothetical protein [Ureibacillus acetophenoni]|uniref:Prepilin-type N-terminal cleavage/methylation domain-containing protein n=1 Tax=Ureibacillus acetophenoni TaxID=614649 RepID=A0A285U996_9BACL|nr:hypothetical protein [Ureibacillus acetophenoni]SOC38277.1 hypothetical protein SAMN05877842_10480 [Ureibacillus acetophenoni]